MKNKHFLFLLLALMATAWIACEKTILEPTKPKTDLAATVRDAVWFEDVTPPAVADNRLLSQATLWGPDTGADTVYISSSGLVNVPYIERGGVVLDGDTIAARGFIRNDTTFVVPTTAAFRTGVALATDSLWTLRITYN